MNTTTNASGYITIGKQRVKQHLSDVYLNALKGTVYLADGDEFEIELYNPLQTRILSEITINGIKIGAGVVLRPGERVYLERFISDNKKFLFSTYTVEDTKENEKAVEKNGLVEIRFYKEKQKEPNRSTLWVGGDIFRNIQPPDPNFYISSSQRTNLPVMGSTCVGGVSPQTLSNVMNSLPVTNVSSVTPTSLGMNTLSTTETGRIEKGSISKQTFSTIDVAFDTMSHSMCQWKILPKSKEIITKDDLICYCTECGTKKKKDSHKFCPHCGNKY